MAFPEKYKVGVRCYTYNQSAYITDAMNGFCIQNTTFPYICTIVDDASTDGEQKVIESYLKEHFSTNCSQSETEYGIVYQARHDSNLNCYFLVILLSANHFGTIELRNKKKSYIQEWLNKSEYLALCEGDDYWTDSSKLQQQVDFLDANQDYVMCFHKAKVISDCGQNTDLYSNLESREYLGYEFLASWIMPTASVLYRNHADDSYPKDSRIVYGDTFLWLTIARQGKIWCLNDSMSVYRRNNGGLTHTINFKNSMERFIGHYQAMYEHFPEVSGTIDKRISNACSWGMIDGFLQHSFFVASLYILKHPHLWRVFIPTLARNISDTFKVKTKQFIIRHFGNYPLIMDSCRNMKHIIKK